MEDDKSKGNKNQQKESLLKHANVDVKSLPKPEWLDKRVRIWEELKQQEKEENAKKGTLRL